MNKSDRDIPIFFLQETLLMDIEQTVKTVRHHLHTIRQTTELLRPQQLSLKYVDKRLAQVEVYLAEILKPSGGDK